MLIGGLVTAIQQFAKSLADDNLKCITLSNERIAFCHCEQIFLVARSNESIKENTMTNSESQIINYFKQFAKMTSGNQKDFWDWKLENAQVLTHVKTDEIRDQYPEIDEWIKNNKVNIVQKQCFRNAGQLCINVDGVDYVEGEILYHGIPMEHAWNKIDGKYFDITKDILFPHNSDYAEYVKIIELDVKEYSRFLFKYKHWGGFIQLPVTSS